MGEQEVSEIIAGRISVQDEEDVEDELAALEAEVAKKDEAGVERLPNVPDTQLPEQRVGEDNRAEPAAERRTAMLA